MMAAAALTRLIRRGNSLETRFLRPLANWAPHHGPPAGPIGTSDPASRLSGQAVHPLLHSVRCMKINAAKSDCVSGCARARHDATVFCIGTPAYCRRCSDNA